MTFTIVAKTHDTANLMESLWSSRELEELRRRNQLIFCGPLEQDGRTTGAILILDAPRRADVEQLVETAPYFCNGHFYAVDIFEDDFKLRPPSS